MARARLTGTDRSAAMGTLLDMASQPNDAMAKLWRDNGVIVKLRQKNRVIAKFA
jgi:hypothetical protein